MISRMLKGSAIALLALLMTAPMASAQRFRGGGGFYGGPRIAIGFGGYWGPGWYGDPYYWGPYAYPYGYYGPNAGQVKLTAPAKTDQVFIDGSYAGLASKMKHFTLQAGSHNIELEDPAGHVIYQQQVQVLAGRTIDVGL
jgi:hypothetical protein